jgi:hypothetical protein
VAATAPHGERIRARLASLDRAEVLAAEGLDEARVERALLALDAATGEAWRNLFPGGAPWDLFVADEPLRFARSAPCRVDEPASGVGAMTYFVDPPHDVRVVAPWPEGGEGWLVLAHELGHARYACGHDPALPWRLRDAPAPWLHEAVAQAEAAQVPGEAARFHRLLGARLRLVHAEVERRGVDGFGEACRRYLGVDVPEPLAWTRLGFLAARPGAGARYLVAEEAALRLAARTGWEERLFAAGASRSADELLAEALA